MMPFSSSQTARRKATSDQLFAALGIQFTETELTPALRIYFDRHGPCDRPPYLQFLCIHVARAMLPGRPDFWETWSEAERQTVTMERLQAAEAQASAFWIGLAREVDELLGMQGCGPHTAWARDAISTNHSAPVARKLLAAQRVTQKATDPECVDKKSSAPGYGQPFVNPDSPGGA